MQLGLHVAMAAVQAGRCSSDSTPSLGTSICHWSDLKKQKKEGKEGRKEGRKEEGGREEGRKERKS